MLKTLDANMQTGSAEEHLNCSIWDSHSGVGKASTTKWRRVVGWLVSDVSKKGKLLKPMLFVCSLFLFMLKCWSFSFLQTSHLDVLKCFRSFSHVTLGSENERFCVLLCLLHQGILTCCFVALKACSRIHVKVGWRSFAPWVQNSERTQTRTGSVFRGLAVDSKS
jgi:hypothetical protein